MHLDVAATANRLSMFLYVNPQFLPSSCCAVVPYPQQLRHFLGFLHAILKVHRKLQCLNKVRIPKGFSQTPENEV